jgi:AAA+ ATPase superfamily predicted ATPase
MEKVIGRKEEQKILDQLLKSEKPEFLAVYGRRRIGKTFLIRQVYNKQIVFQMTGIARANTSQQLSNFFSVLSELDSGIGQTTIPQNWFDAFNLLRIYLQKLRSPKKVIFFDELPWIDTPRSNFLSALEHFRIFSW